MTIVHGDSHYKSKSLYYLAMYYKRRRNYENAKAHFIMIIEGENNIFKQQALREIGDYYRVMKNYENMIKCYNMAIECGSVGAMMTLGHYYCDTNDYDNMLKYYNMGVDNKSIYAMCCLGAYYKKIEDYKNMKKYYLLAIENNNIISSCNKLAPKVIEKMKKEISEIPDDNIVLNDDMYKDELVKRITCCICMANEKNMVFNCGHSTCSSCALKINICSICKTEIIIKIKQFI
jgi:tetratricopeptide (TPR) repeat protein